MNISGFSDLIIFYYQKQNYQPIVEPVKSVDLPPFNTIEKKVIDRRLRYNENIDKIDEQESNKIINHLIICFKNLFSNTIKTY